MNDEEHSAIRFTLTRFRRQALTQFMGEFVQILNDEGYSFEDLLNALANHMHDSNNLHEVECVPILETLIDSLQNLKNNTGASHE